MKKYIAEEFDLRELYFTLYGYVAPPFPTLGDLKSQLLPTTLNTLLSQYRKTSLGTDLLMPLRLEIPQQGAWEIPTEPMISIKGGHKIIRRYPNRSKNGGSIKERWSSDDFTITIKGALIDLKEEKYPENQIKQLRQFCEYKSSIKVENLLCRIFGIERIVIKDYSIPFTQGINIQSYTISAYSDQLFDTLLTEN